MTTDPHILDEVMRLGRQGVSFLDIGNAIGKRPAAASALWRIYATDEERAVRRELVRKAMSAHMRAERVAGFLSRSYQPGARWHVKCELPDDVRFPDDPRAVADRGSARLPLRPATHTHGASSAAIAVG